MCGEKPDMGTYNGWMFSTTSTLVSFNHLIAYLHSTLVIPVHDGWHTEGSCLFDKSCLLPTEPAPARRLQPQMRMQDLQSVRRIAGRGPAESTSMMHLDADICGDICRAVGKSAGQSV